MAEQFPDPIQITGLREFVRGLKAMDRNHAKKVRKIFNKAAKIIVADARPRVPVGPPAGGHASVSIKAASTQNAAKVSEGGSKYPYMPWLDFGGKVGHNNSVVRPFFKSGRFIWKSFKEKRPDVLESLQQGLVELAREAGLDVD